MTRRNIRYLHMTIKNIFVYDGDAGREDIRGFRVIVEYHVYLTQDGSYTRKLRVTIGTAGQEKRCQHFRVAADDI